MRSEKFVPGLRRHDRDDERVDGRAIQFRLACLSGFEQACTGHRRTDLGATTATAPTPATATAKSNATAQAKQQHLSHTHISTHFAEQQQQQQQRKVVTDRTINSLLKAIVAWEKEMIGGESLQDDGSATLEFTEEDQRSVHCVVVPT